MVSLCIACEEYSTLRPYRMHLGRSSYNLPSASILQSYDRIQTSGVRSRTWKHQAPRLGPAAFGWLQLV